MEKRHALFIALAITGVIAGNYLFFYDFNNRESVIISRVLDGDTVELEDGRKVRLLNINTEERGRAWSSEATEYLKQYENKSVELESEGFGSYGRLLGRFYSRTYINLELVELGLAHSYLVEENELRDFKKAEKKAKNEELGIWKKSEKYGCLSVEINKYNEYLVLNNECKINFNEWTIKDESTKQYVFGDLEFEQISLYSGKGEDTHEELYWGRGKVWNNERDSIFIRDSKGLLVFYDSYS
jgi:endonuclease YncB( thermonuclease family)